MGSWHEVKNLFWLCQIDIQQLFEMLYKNNNIIYIVYKSRYWKWKELGTYIGSEINKYHSYIGGSGTITPREIASFPTIVSTSIRNTRCLMKASNVHDSWQYQQIPTNGQEKNSVCYGVRAGSQKWTAIII